MRRIQIQRLRPCFRRRPALLVPPFARDRCQIQVGPMPVLYVDGDLRLVHDPGVTSLQPVIPPTYRLLAPLNRRTRGRIVWETVVPRADDRLHRHLHLFQHARNTVAISIEHATDHEYRDVDGIKRPYGLVPKLAIALVPHVSEGP